MRYARAILWDPQPEPAGGAAAHGASAAADDERRRGHLLGFMRREFGPPGHPSPFDGRIGTRRQVAFAAVPLGPLHDAARSAGAATVNDAVLTVVAGGIRRWLEAHHGPLGTIRVQVPVSLHHEGDDPGNRDSFFSLGVPLAEPDAVARLRAVHAATAARKAGDDALTQDEMMQALARRSPALRALAARLEASPRAFAVAVSNVVGPRSPVTVLGAPVRGLYSLAEIGQRHALRVGCPSRTRWASACAPIRASSTTSRRWPRAPRPRRGRSSRPRDGRRRRGRPQAPGRAPGGRPGRGRRDCGAPRDRRAGGRAGARPRSYLCAFEGPAFLCLDDRLAAERDPRRVREAASASLLWEQVESLVDAPSLRDLAAAIGRLLAQGGDPPEVAESLEVVAARALDLARWRDDPARAVASVPGLDRATALQERLVGAYRRFLRASEPLVEVQDRLDPGLVDALRDVEQRAGPAGPPSGWPTAWRRPCPRPRTAPTRS